MLTKFRRMLCKSVNNVANDLPMDPPRGCHTNPNMEQNENESFRDHLLHLLSLLILTCLVPCILQLCPASFWDASAGSRGTGHVRFSGLAAEKLENTVNVEATRPKRFVQHCLVRVVAWKCILSRVLTAAGCWLAPRLPSVFFWYPASNCRYRVDIPIRWIWIASRAPL